jgi:hypothetical protein
MKFLNRFLLLVAVLYVCASVWPVIAAEADVDEAVEEEATIPDSTDMTLGVKDNPYILPEDFRGGDPDTSLVHCLEDVYYEKQEHSLIYNPDAEALAEGAEFESDPNITWETKVKNEDGTYTTLSSENTNMAADGGKFYAPGTYMISNSGARQVGEGEGGAAGETGADDAAKQQKAQWLVKMAKPMKQPVALKQLQPNRTWVLKFMIVPHLTSGLHSRKVLVRSIWPKPKQSLKAK